ncbi:hypothetical protein CMQ_2883 [Grosmannia clavigera kw1407]|uniref:Uncharacterized protein n=1 Tax=Grosmannia clavigera (strain kw1407 / UAMH 11150) TaxID=655863 RepID=F0XH77_GROCL|nr:uncharacterized protein CMQ_2883 [Grosmannia clavigera kw1407]EFX02954.1 hypothetical protein CMQ_2883 [Grosmannia clavigera kw1407]
MSTIDSNHVNLLDWFAENTDNTRTLFSDLSQKWELDKYNPAMQSSLRYDDFASSEAIVLSYYNEVKAMLKSVTGAVDVLPFDFQVRRNDPSLAVNSRGAPGKAQPFSTVHGDQTANAAKRRLFHFHPEYADRVWKPLRGPVSDFPLAVCDYRTVQDDDRVPCDIIFPDYLGETYNFWPNPQHRFYYIDGQQSNEAWLVKCFDSATATNPNIAQFAPHVAFPYLSARPKIPRESIEVRTFVFYGDKQEAEAE